MCNFNSYSGVPVPPLQLRQHCTPQCQQSFPLQIKGNSLFFKTLYERFESPREIAPSCQKVKIPGPFWRWTQISSRPRGGCWKWRRWWDCLLFDRTFELLTCTGTICVQGKVGMKCLKDMLPATFVHFSCKAHMLHFVAVCERDWLVSWKGSRNECLRNKWCETSERSVPLSPSEREENHLKFQSTKSYTWCQSKYLLIICFSFLFRRLSLWRLCVSPQLCTWSTVQLQPWSSWWPCSCCCGTCSNSTRCWPSSVGLSLWVMRSAFAKLFYLSGRDDEYMPMCFMKWVRVEFNLAKHSLFNRQWPLVPLQHDWNIQDEFDWKCMC